MRVVRRTRPIPRADMTPLVNIALLLIVFFVFVKQKERPVSRQLNVPDRYPMHGYCCGPARPAASIFLLDSNRVGYLSYRPDSTAEYLETDYSRHGLRRQLRLTALKEHPFVLLIPTTQSTVENLVDALDELTINKQTWYSLAYQLLPGEQRMMAVYQQYKQTNPQQPVSMRMSLYSKRFDWR